MSFSAGAHHGETEFSKQFSAATDPDLTNFSAPYRERLCQQAPDADAGQQDRYMACLSKVPALELIPGELQYLLRNTPQQQPPVHDVNHGADLHDPNEDDTASRATTTESYMNLQEGNGQILSHQKEILRNFNRNLHASSPPTYRNPRQTPGPSTRPPRTVPPQLSPSGRALSDMTSVVPSRQTTPVPRRAANQTNNLQKIAAAAQHRRQSQGQSHLNNLQQQRPQPNQKRLMELQSEHGSLLQEYRDCGNIMLDLDDRLNQIQCEMNYLSAVAGYEEEVPESSEEIF